MDLMNSQPSDILNLIAKYQSFLFLCDRMEGDDDVVLQHCMAELRTLKTEYVNQRHKNKDGTPKQIVQKDLGKGKTWVTYLDANTRITAKTKDALYEKLFEHYSGIGGNYSFATMFELGMSRRNEIKNANDDDYYTSDDISQRNSANRIRSDYKTFILDDFAKMDIRKITPEVLREYSIKTLKNYYQTRERKVKKKAFKENYRLVLNIAFDYAASQNICPNFIRDKTKFDPSDYQKLLNNHKKKAETVVFNDEQLDAMANEVRARINNPKKYGTCYTNGYIFLFARYTGLRIGEECALQKEDVEWDKNRIHVNKQQLCDKETKEYYLVDYTKNENESEEITDGRYVPLLPEAKAILLEMLEKQKEAGIESEWLFANEDGSWVKKESQYTQFLERLSKKFGYTITNHHAIRKYFNSYILLPAGIEVADRAKILGHSVETNLKYYTFEHHDYCEQAFLKLTEPANTVNICG